MEGFQGVNFMNFMLHMSIGVFFVSLQTYALLRLKYRNLSDLQLSEPRDVQDMRRELAVWRRAAASLSTYSKDENIARETLLRRVKHLNRLLKKKISSGAVPAETYKQTLEDFQKMVSEFPFLPASSPNGSLLPIVSHSKQGSSR